MGLCSPAEYWSRVAEEKTFGHPLDTRLLSAHLDRDARILDWGCGYGRLLMELRAAGYRNLVGLDFAPGMIERGKRECAQLDLRLDEGPERDAELGLFDAVLLFSVWTCVPDDRELDALMRRVRGVLRPGGLVHVSDLLLQSDVRNRQRYERFADPGPYGIFELDEGVRVRHFTAERVKELLASFEEVHATTIATTTMNGHAVSAFQFLGRLEGER
jgi:SAM-dependent methyltransferase